MIAVAVNMEFVTTINVSVTIIILVLIVQKIDAPTIVIRAESVYKESAIARWDILVPAAKNGYALVGLKRVMDMVNAITRVGNVIVPRDGHGMIAICPHVFIEAPGILHGDLVRVTMDSVVVIVNFVGVL